MQVLEVALQGAGCCAMAEAAAWKMTRKAGNRLWRNQTPAGAVIAGEAGGLQTQRPYAHAWVSPRQWTEGLSSAVGVCRSQDYAWEKTCVRHKEPLWCLWHIGQAQCLGSETSF